MDRQDYIGLILDAVDTGKVIELQVTSQSGGNEARGIPTTKRTKMHELVGSNIVEEVREVWITTGIAKVGDVTLTTAEELTMTNQILHNGVTYDIVNEMKDVTMMGTFYSYVLRKVI